MEASFAAPQATATDAAAPVSSSLLSVRRRRSTAAVVIDLTAMTFRRVSRGAEALVDFNVLETALLGSSIAVLLSGMVFESSQIGIDGGIAHGALTVFVSFVLLGSVALFVAMLGIETRRTCHGGHAGRGDVASVGGTASSWNRNPMHRRGLSSSSTATDGLRL